MNKRTILLALGLIASTCSVKAVDDGPILLRAQLAAMRQQAREEGRAQWNINSNPHLKRLHDQVRNEIILIQSCVLICGLMLDYYSCRQAKLKKEAPARVKESENQDNSATRINHLPY